MKSRKTVLTTGQVAKICSVAPRTVSKWFDQGHLKGYRIPGSKDRRIPLEALVQFMKANDIPLNGLETGSMRMLVVDSDAGFAETLVRALEEDGSCEATAAGSMLEAGARLQEHTPQVMIVNVSQADVVPKAVSQFLQSSPELSEVKLIGVAPNLTPPQGEALRQDGFHGYLAKPFDVRSLFELIDGLE